jgi:hypothetical protein
MVLDRVQQSEQSRYVLHGDLGGNMTSRPLGVSDLPMLQRALDQDEYEHLEPKYFTMDSAYSVVYEDEGGPIGVLRYTKENDRLRLVTVWCSNADSKRNAASVIVAIADSVRLARQSGYKKIVFCTQSPSLARFCIDRLGFEEDKGEYVLPV